MKIKNTEKNKKGFTLVELLVVLAIIGLLAVIAIPIILNAQKKSRDTARLKQLQSIQAGASSVYTKAVNTVTISIAASPQNGTASKPAIYATRGSNTIVERVDISPYTLRLVTACAVPANPNEVVAIHNSAANADRNLTFCNEDGDAGEVLSY
jgi:prepilin-type N-terminal cleavage/methylation domain-containing protein